MAADKFAAKFARALRHFNRSRAETEGFLAPEHVSPKPKAEYEDLAEQVEAILNVAEPAVTEMQEALSAFENDDETVQNGSDDDTAKKLDDMSDGLYAAQALIRRLKTRLNRLQKLSQYSDRMSRASSRSDFSEGRSTVFEQQPANDDQDESHPEDGFADRLEAENRSQDGALERQNDLMIPRPTVQGTAEGQPASDDPVRLLCERLLQISTPAASNGNRSSTESNFKLPKYNLPKYSGDPEAFQSFWDRFTKAVGDRTTLAKVEKLQYLIDSLEGDAQKLLAGLPLSNDNYDVAVSLLKERFGNEKIAIEKIYSSLIDMPAVPSRDCKKLREFYFDLESSLRRLEALGADTKSDHLVGVALRKLPRPLVAQLERAKGARNQWSMKLLRDVLGDELEIQEATYGRNLKDKEKHSQPEDKKHSGGWNDRRKTTESFAGSDKKAGPNPKSKDSGRSPKCFYCGESHWSGDCGKYKTGSERREVAKKARRCFICLSDKHQARNCPSEKPCYHCKKVRLHHASLCPEKFPDSRNGDSARKGEEETDLTKDQETSGLANDEYAVLKTAKCEALNPDDDSLCAEGVRVFFDTGTSRTWATERLAKKLKLKVGRKQRLLVNRFADDEEPKTIEMREAVLTVRNSAGHRWKIVVAVKSGQLGSVTLANKSQLKRHIPMDLALADSLSSKDAKVPIDLMIGSDYYDDLVFCERIRISPGIWMINSAFGWLISGRMSSKTTRPDSGMFVMTGRKATADFDDDLFDRPGIGKDFQVENLWNLESIGIKDEPNDISDDIAIEKFNETVKIEDGRYSVQWPWRKNADMLPKNDDIALRRLRSLIARTKKQGRFDFLHDYDAIIRDQLEKAVIEEVHPEEIDSENKVHYLSHHGVEKPDRATTKIRVVYNASYRRNDLPSLNDCLYRGQVYMEHLVILLIRFRLHPIAVIGDLEKAFLKIGLQKSERDVTRFYWVRDVNAPPEGENLVVYRFTRVSFGVKSSPFLLGATVAYHLKQQKSEIANQIERDLYVDNLITGTDTVREAIELYSESKKIFHAGNMNIRDFGSNSAEFDDRIDDVDKANRNPVKVLGMSWDKQEDRFSARSYAEDQQGPWTKKKVMSVVLQMYDPVGIACPVILSGKIFLQKLNKKNVHWDEKLPADLEEKWMKIKQNLSEVDRVETVRYLGFKLEHCDRLMVFCDASADAYAAVVYMQKVSEGICQSHLIFAKARVSPLKSMTIPRLELMAVLLGVRMIKFLRARLPFNGKAVIWSDSQCVLRWIPDRKMTGIFVENRLREIRKAENAEFRYVPTNENPADLASRGCAVGDLNSLWWHGPEWAAKPETDWPQWSGNVDSKNKSEEENEDSAQNVTEEQPISPFGINVEKFSNFTRLIRVTAYCLRFLYAARKQKTYETVQLNPTEIRDASLTWIKWAQASEYSVMMADMKRQKLNSKQQQLGVRVDEEGILRCHGRLALIDATDDTKFPILLPSKSHLTSLIIADRHRKALHAGESQTLASVRQEFWIPRGRARVKQVLSNCSVCRLHEGRPFARPPMPELPAARVSRQRPFQHVGLDYFGPLYVKTQNSENEEKMKRWVCIITCLAVRAIHLEMVENLSAEEFLLALRRFVARKGKPESIVCDNATQFKAVRSVDPISATLSGDQIEWNFIPELSPWAGGVYERLIKSVKSAMKKTLGRRLIKDTELRTILTEVENAVNSRSLTYVNDDINSSKVLTPNDFLMIQPEESVGKRRVDEADPDYSQGPEKVGDNLLKLHKRLMNQLEDLWSVWQTEYLLSLREKTKYGHKDAHGAIKRQPHVGEVVVVRDEKLNRGKWKLGKVESIKPTTDGKIRSVEVRMNNGSTLMRPVNFLYPIELQPDNDKREEGNSTKKVTDTVGETTRTTRRKAAEEARLKIKNLIDNEDSGDEG